MSSKGMLWMKSYSYYIQLSSVLAERSSGMQGQEGYEPFNTTLLPCFLLQWWKRPKESSSWDKACTVWTTARGRIRMEFREIIQSLDRQGVCPEVKSVCMCVHLHRLPVRQIQRRVWAHTLVHECFCCCHKFEDHWPLRCSPCQTNLWHEKQRHAE